MKGLTLVACFSKKTVGGMELDSLKCASLLKEVTPVIFACSNKSKLHLRSQESDFSHLDVQTTTFHFNLSIRLILQLRKILIENNVKNIIFFGASEIKSIYFSLIGLDVNFIVRHGTTRVKKKDDFFHRFLYKRINYHLTISEHLKNNVYEMIPIARLSNIVKVYCSPNLSECKTKKKNPDKEIKTLLCLARIDPGKGQKEAIEVTKKLLNQNIASQLLIYGPISNEDYYSELQLLVNNDPVLKKSIHFLGATNKVSAAFESADLLLFPSWGEGMPNTIIEAMFHSLPIVCFNNTAFPEFQQLGFHLHLAKDKDIDDLFLKVKQTLEHLDQEFNLANKNQQLALKVFSKQQEQSNLLEILN